MNVGIIGFGYWGPNLLRNFVSSSECKVTMVSDLRTERLSIINRNYPSIETTTQVNDILQNEKIDAVIIATPVFTHFSLAQKAILNGKHVLLEKPMTNSTQEAEELIELATKHNKVLMVDHTFLYTGAVQKIKLLIDSGSIGQIQYFDSTRINLGLFQHDVNVLWDLAPHDISIANYLIPETPIIVQAIGVSHTNTDIENIAYLILKYQSGVIAHFNCSWTSPVKIRQILIGGNKKMIVFNDMEPTEKVKIYDSGYEIRSDEDKQKLLVDYRTGDVFAPKIEIKEALLGVTMDFVNAVVKKIKPLADHYSGFQVVKILEAAQNSIKNKGKEVFI